MAGIFEGVPTNFEVKATFDITPGAMIFLAALVAFIVFTAK